jgi:nitroreductase
MEFSEVVRGRRMVRNYTAEPVAEDVLRRLLDQSRRAPSAGNTQATAFVVLRGEEVQRYWNITLPEQRRQSFPWPGLLRAPVLVLVVSWPAAYVQRYAEADKASTGLGADVSAWAVPYWDVDAGFAAMNLLLGATDVGLGALFFGLFNNRAEVMREFAIPSDRSVVGVIALGHPAPDRPSHSATARKRPDLDEVVHWGGWTQGSPES